MNEIALPQERIMPMSPAAIEQVRAWEEQLREMPNQVLFDTWHVLHGGVYSRTIKIPAGVMLTGALIKVPTTLTFSGDVVFFANDQRMRLTGYHVVPASAGRKQAFVAIEDTALTMAFSTSATTIEQAEEEFTDDFAQLISRNPEAVNYINITGE